MIIVRVAGLTALLAVVLLLPEMITAVTAAFIWALCLTVLARSHRNGVLSLPSMYLALLGIFHLGLVVPVALGATPEDIPDWVGSPYLGAALSLFATACVGFTLGASVRAPDRTGEPPPSLRPQPQLFQVGLVVAALGAALLWTGVLRLGLLSSSYGQYFQRALSDDVREFGFGLMLFPIGLVVAAAGATPRQIPLLAGVVLVVLGPLFLRGFRGPMIVHSMALLTVWVRKDRRVARRVAFAGFVGAMVLAPAVRISRNLDRNFSEGLRSVDPLFVLFESGGSLHPLVLTTELVESGAPLWKGRSYQMAAERVLPNVGTRPRTAQDLNPSAWVTLHADVAAFDRGEGLGFSGVAEPYLNFGRFGVVAFFILLGLAIRGADRWLARDPFRGAIAAASFGFVLWTVRNEAMEVFRAATIASTIVLVAWSATRLARRWRPAERTGGVEATDGLGG